MESIIFSSYYDKIPNELWKSLINAIVENIFRRKKSKLHSDLDFGNKITTGFSSNFQKLSWFAAQVLIGMM